jgi:flagellar assembly protein FliH
VLSRDANAVVQRWDLPLVAGEIHTGVGRESVRPLTAGDLQSLQKNAYAEAFELGRREGREAGHREMAAEYQQRLHSAAMLLRSLARPLEQLDEGMERTLVDMVVLIARQLIRRELKTSHGEIVAVVREAVAALPLASRHPRIHLNPEDAEIVRQAFSLGDAQDSYTLEEDPLISCGGCLIETATSFIDATVEARLNATIAQMFGGEREGERSD